jgi:hypothetical protein
MAGGEIGQMKSISVILNEHSRHTIDLKDEYNHDEFIEYFEHQLRLVKEYRLDAPMTSPPQKHLHKQATSANVAELTEDDC